MYTWVGKFKKEDEPVSNDLKVLQAEMAKLKAELRRTTEERDILKKAAAFIQAHRCEFKLTSMCRVLKVHRGGFYAWLYEPLSPSAKANEMLTAKTREFYDQSMGIYGSPRIFCDLREAGVACGENRVARLMRAAGIKSVRGYKRPKYKVGKPALVAPNQLQRQFQHNKSDQAWVKDIPFIRTLEG